MTRTRSVLFPVGEHPAAGFDAGVPSSWGPSLLPPYDPLLHRRDLRSTPATFLGPQQVAPLSLSLYLESFHRGFFLFRLPYSLLSAVVLSPLFLSLQVSLAFLGSPSFLSFVKSPFFPATTSSSRCPAGCAPIGSRFWPLVILNQTSSCVDRHFLSRSHGSPRIHDQYSTKTSACSKSTSRTAQPCSWYHV